MGGITRRGLVAQAGIAAAGLAVAGTAGWYGWQHLTRRRPDHADLAYGPGVRQRLDIYLPEGATKPTPFVIDIHGGAFRIGDKAMNAPAASLLDAGIAIVRPNYRLTDTDIWPAQGEDCLAAARLVLTSGADLGLDPARFALWGQSAGAFLAVSTALSLIEALQPPRAVASFYGPMDFATMDADMAALGRTAAMGSTDAADSAESMLLGRPVAEDRAGATAMGPVGRLQAMGRRALPPLFVRHGDADPMIAHGQSERLVAAWAAADPSATIDFALVPGAGHGGGDFDSDAVMAPLRDHLLAAFRAG